MSAQAYLVADDLPGQLWIMACPEAAMLSDRLQGLKGRGVDTVVSLLDAADIEALGVAREPQLCTDHGIAFISHPIADFGLPDPATFAPFLNQIAALLHAGHSVVVHCRAGIGRSGMTTAGALIALGRDSAEASTMVANARGVPIPDTVAQATFIADLPKILKNGNISSI